jgi:hypothetical protein
MLILDGSWVLYLLKMFGMKKERTPQAHNETPDITRVDSQFVSNRTPTIFDPTADPKRPNISEIHTAMALKLVGNWSTVALLATGIARPHISKMR